MIHDCLKVKEDISGGIQTPTNSKLLGHTELKQMFAANVNNLIKQCSLDPHESNGTFRMLCGFSFSFCSIEIQENLKIFLRRKLLLTGLIENHLRKCEEIFPSLSMWHTIFHQQKSLKMQKRRILIW